MSASTLFWFFWFSPFFELIFYSFFSVTSLEVILCISVALVISQGIMIGIFNLLLMSVNHYFSSPASTNTLGPCDSICPLLTQMLLLSCVLVLYIFLSLT